jgi:N-ethylmaleimide reductase
MEANLNQPVHLENSKLFTPVQVGPYLLAHRVVLAPMTRLRSTPDDSPSEMMVKFYEQRASQGNLLIVEGTSVSIGGRSYLGAPGIYTQAQQNAWKKVVDAVHAKGGRIICQLFHGGRQSHSDMTGGVQPVAPSVVPYEGIARTQDGFVPTSPHRALELDEIPGVIEEFKKAAERALAAGFDGVEIHSANGYLPDQFLQDGTNHRTDAYGGTIENRAKFLLEIVEATASIWGENRVGVRISPSGEWGQISDSDPERTFSYLAKRLNDYDLLYLHVIEPRIKGDDTLIEGQGVVASAYLRKIYKGTLLAAGGFTASTADEIVTQGGADLVAFGRWYSSNPDLPYRLKNGLPLTKYNRDAFWGGDEHGYIDFLPYKQEELKDALN